MCCLCTVGQVVHTLSEGRPVDGITSLAGEIYLLRLKERDEVEVYDVISYRLQRCLTVPDAKGFSDMTSCEHYHCVYISDPRIECIHTQLNSTQLTTPKEKSGLQEERSYKSLYKSPILQ